MGLMRWLRGGEENSAATSVMSAGLAEIDGLFRPSRHKQTEHIEQTKRRRVDVSTGCGVDLDRGVAVIRARSATGAPAGSATGEPELDPGTRPAAGIHPDHDIHPDHGTRSEQDTRHGG